VLSRGYPTDTDQQRLLANILLKLPAVTAVRLGITDVGVVSALLGGMMYLHYPLTLLGCLVIARREPGLTIFPLLSTVAAGMNASFFIVSESHLLASLFWPLALMLLLHRPWTWRSLIGVALVAAPTLRTYESMAILGPPLLALACWRGVTGKDRLDRIGSAALAAWFAAGIVIAILAIIHPREPLDLDSFLRSSAFYVDWRNNFHYMALASLASVLTILMLLLVGRSGSRALDGAVLVACVLPLGAAATVVAWPESLVPILHYRARVLNSYMPPVLLAAMLLVRAAPAQIAPAAWARSWLVLLCLTIGQLVWNVAAAVQWQGYLGLFRTELAAHAGLVPYFQTRLARPLADGRPAAAFTWGWTMPTMSILLAPEGRVASIIANPPGWVPWQPFDPADPVKLPPLSRYGITYDSYLAANRP
jgi:hypothetical protein